MFNLAKKEDIEKIHKMFLESLLIQNSLLDSSKKIVERQGDMKKAIIQLSKTLAEDKEIVSFLMSNSILKEGCDDDLDDMLNNLREIDDRAREIMKHIEEEKIK